MPTLIRAAVAGMQAYTPGEQPATPVVAKLNTNENPYPPSPRVVAALRELDPNALRLYSDPQCRALRARIATLHACDPDQVFVGNGSDEVLALCTRAFVEDDGSIGYFDPSYSLYPVLADIRGVARRPLPLGDAFEWPRHAASTAPLFLLTNPNAPTGFQYAADDVGRFCAAAPGVVLIDEAYVDFADSDCLALALAQPNVLVARTLSKAYSLAGLRVGYAVGPRPLIAALNTVKDSYNLGVLPQRLALAALEDVPWMRANAERIRATRRRLETALRGLGYDVTPSQTNFVWARPLRRAAREVFERLRQDGIIVRYFPGPRTGAHLRITVGTDAEIDRLLAALAAAPPEGVPTC
jgi:histidinol-phosphate aminotransferase